jgi:hypothetical protein
METSHRAAHGETTNDTRVTERYALDLIAAIRELYLRHFDNGWFMTILERHSFNRLYLNDIKRLIELTALYPGDYYRLRDGVRALTEFIGFCRRCVLPVLRDELGLSGFDPAGHRDDPTTQVVKGFFAYTFPANLEQLSELTGRLRESTDELTGLSANSEPAPGHNTVRTTRAG